MINVIFLAENQMNNYSIKAGENLYLTSIAPTKKEQPAKVVEIPTNHVVVIDCSGSMSCDLPKIREQLKLKLPKLLADKDTISIIWFSGRGEFGTLLKGEFVSSLKDLNDVNKAIDRWLRPNCLTGFKEPLEEAVRLVTDVQKKNPGVFSLFFMSDGYDNQWSQAEILTAMEKAAGCYASTTIVEYGYYCNRNLMAAMAEKAGAALIFSADFDGYEPTFESVMQKKVSGAPRIELTLHDTPVGGFAFAIHGTELITFGCVDGKILVPEDFESVWYLSENPFSVESKIDLSEMCHTLTTKSTALSVIDFTIFPGVRAIYAAMSLYGQRMLSDVVYSLLRATGDVKLINKFSSCFGKQLYSDFCELTSNIALSGNGMFMEGRDSNKVPKDDAFTVIDLLKLLSEDEGNRILFEHPLFKYSRIGRGRVDSSDLLSEEEQAEVAQLTEAMTKTKVGSEIKKHQARINEILASKKEALKFVPDPAPNGYSISALKTNEERPNMSILLRKEGTVDLSSRLTKELEGVIPATFKTFIWRNYAIVADGLVNVEFLPCKITSQTALLLGESNCPSEYMQMDLDNHIVTFNLRQIPVINRKMVQAVSARTLFEQEFELTKLRTAQKVFNTYVKDMSPPTRGAEGIAALYGEAAATWLKEQGITDGGFNPKVVQAESTDFYMGKEVVVSIKGYSKIPSVKELKEMVKKGKVNAPGALMQPFYNEVEAYLNDPTVKGVVADAAIIKWLEDKAKDTTNQVRRLLFLKAQQVFSIVVGQVWPSEFSSLDENTLSITVDQTKIDGKIEQKEVKIKI